MHLNPVRAGLLAGQAPPEWASLRRGWRLGAEDFAGRLGRRGRRHELASQLRETDEKLAERLIKEWLWSNGWRERDLARKPKGAGPKAELARLLRRHTPMSRQWIVDRFHLGSASYISHLTTQSPNA